MAAGGSITRCLDDLKRGDPDAAARVWDAYIRRLVALARQRLRAAPRRIADEEDVALSAFDSFFRRAAEGQFARLDDRDDLWQLLVLITERKAVDLVRTETRQRRDARRSQALADSAAAGLADPGPTPDFAAQVADELRRLLDRLVDPSLRSVALWKMEGHTNREIARKLGCIEQTVERKLRSIRRLWEAP